MTQWVETPRGGRERGARGLARAWVEVLVRPGRFFRNGVAPGDQAPGLAFAVAVSLAYVCLRYAFVPAARPLFFGGRPAVSLALAVLAVGLVVAPLALHLTAAVQTVLLVVGVRDRAGVSETVQVVAYATAPAVLLGLAHAAHALPPGLLGPLTATEVVAAVRLVTALWGAGLLVLGIRAVHRTSLARAAFVAAVPALFVFGYAFGGVFAVETLTGWDLVNTAPPGGRA